MNTNFLQIPAQFLIPIIGLIVWLVRLEGKVKQNDKDIERIEKGWLETHRQMLDAMESLQKNVIDLTIKIERMMERVEHMKNENKAGQ